MFYLRKLRDDGDAIRVGLASTYLHHSQSCILSHGGFLSGLSDKHQCDATIMLYHVMTSVRSFFSNQKEKEAIEICRTRHTPPTLT